MNAKVKREGTSRGDALMNANRDPDGTRREDREKTLRMRRWRKQMEMPEANGNTDRPG